MNDPVKVQFAEVDANGMHRGDWPLRYVAAVPRIKDGVILPDTDDEDHAYEVVAIEWPTAPPPLEKGYVPSAHVLCPTVYVRRF